MDPRHYGGRLLIILLAGLTACGLTAAATAAEESENRFEAFTTPQDRFEIVEAVGEKLTLRAEFTPARQSVMALVLTAPEEPSFTLQISEGVAVDLRDRRNTLKIDGETLAVPESLIQSSRAWLGDVPLAVIRFVGIEQFRPTGYDGPPAARFYLQSATLTFQFESPVFTSTLGGAPRGATGETAVPTDPIGQAASGLVLNPTDIPRFRGLPSSFLKDRSQEGASAWDGTDGSTLLRMETPGQGVARLRMADLVETLGDGREIPIDSLRLFRRGESVPFAVERADSSPDGMPQCLWFLDPPSDNDQSAHNVFFVKVDAASTEPAPRIEPSGVFPPPDSPFASAAMRDWDFRKIRFEKDDPLLMEFVGEDGDVELFWTAVGDKSFHHDFDLSLPAVEASPEAATSHLIIRFDPRKKPAKSPRIRINRQTAADHGVLRFDGDGSISVAFPSKFLLPRGNRITLEFENAAALPPPLAPKIDWIEIDHPSTVRVDAPVLDLAVAPWPGGAATTTCRLAADATENLRLLEVDESGVPLRTHRLPPDDQGGVQIPVRGSSPCYRLIDLGRASDPLSLTPVRGPRLSDRLDRPVDQIVIAAPRYFPLLEGYLREVNERTKIQSLLVSPQEIYDEFSQGEKDFRSIKRFLAHALRRLPDPKPRWVWLVGESRWDPRNRLGSAVLDEVPTPPLKTEIGLAGDDQWYVQLLGEDHFPDMLVSRTSVSNEQELESYLDKARAWRTGRPLGWHRATALELADRDFFVSVEEMFRRGLHREFFPRSLHLSDYPMDTIRKFEAIGKVGVEGRGARDNVVRLWDEGASMVEYLGHGGITVWSKEAMFLGLNRPDSDVDRLAETDQFPFVYIRSCLSGTVNWPIHPGEVSVSEALVRAPKRGAAMVLSAVGTEQQPDQEQFARHFHHGWSDLGFRAPALLRLFAHCRSLIQKESYLSVCRQFILHGDPTLEMEAPEKFESISFAVEGTKRNARLVASGRAGFSAKGQIRLHNISEVLFESEIFEVEAGDFRAEFALALPVTELGETYACLYTWNESEGRDAFGAQRVEILPDPIVKKQAPATLTDGSADGPFSGGSLLIQTPVVHSGLSHQGNLRLEAAESLEATVEYKVKIGDAPESYGIIHPRGYAIALTTFRFDQPGLHTLGAIASASDVSEGSWTQRFEIPIQLLEPPVVEIEAPVVEPKIPVTGETLDFRTSIRNIGSTTAALEAIDGTLVGIDVDLPERRLMLNHSNRFRFPLLLAEGESLSPVWRCENNLPEGEFLFRGRLTVDGEVHETTRTVRVLPPPEIRTLAIEGPGRPFGITGDETLPLSVRVRNVGGATSDPMILVGTDTIWGATFEGKVDSLDPGETATVAVTVDHPGSLFEWITTYRQLPEAITLRTRTGSQKFDLEVERSIKAAPLLEVGGSMDLKAESRLDFAPFRIRYFELTQAGLRSTNADRLFDFNPGELEFPETSNILSATQPALAALENPGVWWMTPTRIETSPTQSAPPLRFRTPWKLPSAVGKISPKFVKTPSYLGYPTPFLLLESPEESFELDFSQVGYEGVIPPRMIEIRPPGLMWTLHNRVGGWPTFSGFLFMALPEIRTPVLELPESGPWVASMDFEWIEKPEANLRFEASRRVGDEVWSEWEPLTGDPLLGDRFRLRCTLDPAGSGAAYSIRSIEVKFSKD